jgi:hypothetical protein
MKKIISVFFLAVMLISCGGKKEVKQVSQESRTATEAFAVAEAVKNAFIKRDMATIQSQSTDAGFRDITASKKGYDSVELTFTPRWVEIEGSQLFVNIAWKSAWTISGRKSEERGMAVFVMEGTPLRISKIMRANPFIFPE